MNRCGRITADVPKVRQPPSATAFSYEATVSGSTSHAVSTASSRASISGQGILWACAGKRTSLHWEFERWWRPPLSTGLVPGRPLAHRQTTGVTPRVNFYRPTHTMQGL